MFRNVVMVVTWKPTNWDIAKFTNCCAPLTSIDIKRVVKELSDSSWTKHVEEFQIVHNYIAPETPCHKKRNQKLNES